MEQAGWIIDPRQQNSLNLLHRRRARRLLAGLIGLAPRGMLEGMHMQHALDAGCFVLPMQNEKKSFFFPMISVSLGRKFRRETQKSEKDGVCVRGHLLFFDQARLCVRQTSSAVRTTIRTHPCPQRFGCETASTKVEKACTYMFQMMNSEPIDVRPTSQLPYTSHAHILLG